MSSINYGRARIVTDMVLTGNVENDKKLIPLIIQNSMAAHNNNKLAYTKNEKWYFNDTEAILAKNKMVRTDVNNKITFAKPRSVVKMNNGYCFGNPFKYVCNEAEKPVNEQMQAFNKCLQAANNYTHTLECAKNAAIFGIGYKLALPPTTKDLKNGMFFEIVSDINNFNTFMVYSNNIKKEEVLGVNFYTRNKVDAKGVVTNETETVYNCWTKWHQWKFIQDASGNYNNEQFTVIVDGQALSLDAYPFKLTQDAIAEEVDIPLQEYERTGDRVGDFELSISLMNAINVLASCRVDSVQQNVDYIIKLRDIDVGEFDDNGNNPVLKKIKEFMAEHFLAVNSRDGADVQPDIDVLDIPLNQSEVQQLQDFLSNELLEELQQPTRSSGTGQDTGIAVENRNGFRQFENQAVEITAYTMEAEKSFIAKLLEIGKQFEGCPFKDLKPSDITIKTMRNRSENLITSTDAFSKMINAGVNRQTAYNESGLVADVTDTVKLDEEAKLKDSELELNQEIKKQQALNKLKPADSKPADNKKADGQ